MALDYYKEFAEDPTALISERDLFDKVDHRDQTM